MRIDETKAIVTGGASGLGAATVRALRAGGAQVCILDRDAERGEAMTKDTGATFVQVNITQETSVSGAISAAVARMHGLTAAINCAGIATGARIIGRDGPHSFGQFRNTIDINLSGTFNVMRLAAEVMAKNPGPERGVIVNTASIAAYDGQKGQAAYAASKAGIAGMTLPAARDLASFGIRVCAIAPGVFMTPMVEGLPPDVQAGLAADIPFPRRLGDPAEFAALVCFILTCGYLNGEVIRLDGALRMR